MRKSGIRDINGKELCEGAETNHGIVTFGTDGLWRVLNNIPVPDIEGEPQGCVGCEHFLDEVINDIKIVA